MSNLGHPRIGALRPGLTALPFGRHRMVTMEVLPSGWKLGDQQVLPWGTSYAVGEKATPQGRHAKILKDLVLIDGQESQQTQAGWVWVRIYETLTKKPARWKADVRDRAVNGLERITRSEIALPGVNLGAYVQGTQIDPYGTDRLLATSLCEEDDRAARITSEYLEKGIVDARTSLNSEAGIRYVNFQAFGARYVPTCLKEGSAVTDDPTVAFQGGAEAAIVFDRIGNVKGLRTYDVTVMMKADGSPLVADGTDNEVASYQRWAEYQKPGILTVNETGVSAKPGNGRWVKVKITEALSTSGAMDDGYKPFSVKEWASFNLSYIPSDGSAPVVEGKGASGYLSESSFTITGGGTFAGVEVDSAAGVAKSDPTPATFSGLADQVIGSDNDPSFITDAGVRWYRKRKIAVIGTFGSYFDA